jgi:hypothetical protein
MTLALDVFLKGLEQMKVGIKQSTHGKIYEPDKHD